MKHAKGTFEVKIEPVAMEQPGGGAVLGRLSIEKSFAGDLVGTGRGEMLSARTPVESSAGYVAIERVTGTLEGRSGAFVLLHRGVMTKEGRELRITVVPDSGSGGLSGLAGELAIEIVDGEHFYDLEYSLPSTP